MFRHFRHPDIPTSSPDMMTFPFEFKDFQFTMDNFVGSFTRKRVTKENLAEVIEEVNAAIKGDSDGFKTWDYLSILFLLAVNGAIIACICTMDMKDFVMFAIKLGVIFAGIMTNFIVFACCLGGSITTLRDKIQNVLDARDEYFDTKGMKWAVCTDTDFPYWIELHIQSQFEMKAEKEEQPKQNPKDRYKVKDSEEIDIGTQGYGTQVSQSIPNKKAPKKQEIPRLMKLTNNRNGFADLGIDEDDAENEQSAVQPKPKPPKEIEISVQDNKKFDRLYAPLEEDYEEVYEPEANL